MHVQLCTMYVFCAGGLHHAAAREPAHDGDVASGSRARHVPDRHGVASAWLLVRGCQCVAASVWLLVRGCQCVAASAWLPVRGC